MAIVTRAMRMTDYRQELRSDLNEAESTGLSATNRRSARAVFGSERGSENSARTQHDEMVQITSSDE